MASPSLAAPPMASTSASIITPGGSAAGSAKVALPLPFAADTLQNSEPGHASPPAGPQASATTHTQSALAAASSSDPGLAPAAHGAPLVLATGKTPHVPRVLVQHGARPPTATHAAISITSASRWPSVTDEQEDQHGSGARVNHQPIKPQSHHDHHGAFPLEPPSPGFTHEPASPRELDEGDAHAEPEGQQHHSQELDDEELPGLDQDGEDHDDDDDDDDSGTGYEPAQMHALPASPTPSLLEKLTAWFTVSPTSPVRHVAGQGRSSSQSPAPVPIAGPIGTNGSGDSHSSSLASSVEQRRAALFLPRHGRSFALGGHQHQQLSENDAVALGLSRDQGREPGSASDRTAASPAAARRSAHSPVAAAGPAAVRSATISVPASRRGWASAPISSRNSERGSPVPTDLSANVSPTTKESAPASTKKTSKRQHRYGSFVPARRNVPARWTVNGRQTFEAIAEALESAQEEIFIAGWWVTPELYLRRDGSAPHRHVDGRFFRGAVMEKSALFVYKACLFFY